MMKRINSIPPQKNRNIIDVDDKIISNHMMLVRRPQKSHSRRERENDAQQARVADNIDGTLSNDLSPVWADRLSSLWYIPSALR